MSGERLTGVSALLAEARSGLVRLEPEDALNECGRGAVLIDIRSDAQIGEGGALPGATRIPRNVLEWRLDPSCPHAIPELARAGTRVIIVCDEGYQSSLAAATLRRFGIDATDLIGGFQAWRASGLPVEPAEVERSDR